MFIPSPKLNQVFASRWKALWWAAGICLTAYCTVPAAENHAQGGQGAVSAEPAQGADQAQVRALAGALGLGEPAPQPSSAANPWAKDPAGQH